jgi:hypothetical protein
MDKTIFVINCHGKSELKKRFNIPENTCVITLNEVGVTLTEQYDYFWTLSDDISRGPPLFLKNYNSKQLSPKGEELQHFLSTDKMFEDEELTLRNHLPGDNMTDIILTFNEDDESQRKFFNISKKSSDTDPIRNFSEITDVYLSDYIKMNGPGVYVLLVCRSLPHYEDFLRIYKQNVDFRDDINTYLISPQRRPNIKRDIIKNDLDELMPILDDMVKHKITPDQVIKFLTEPPQLTLARKHSDVTDEVEGTIWERKEVHKYYYKQIDPLMSHIDNIKKEIKTYINPKKKDLPHDSINLNGKINVTQQTNTTGLMDLVVQIEDRFFKSINPSAMIELFLSVFDPSDEPFLHGKIVELKMLCDEINELKEKIEYLPNDALTRRRSHDLIESRTVPDSLDSLDGEEDGHWLMSSYGGKSKKRTIKHKLKRKYTIKNLKFKTNKK